MPQFLGYGKPLTSDQLHLTLLFVGSVDDSLLSHLIDNVDKLKMPSSSVDFGVINYWASASVLCLESRDLDCNLGQLHNELKKIATDLGLKAETLPFKPHITLCRKCLISIERKVPAFTLEINSFGLYKTTQTPNGSHYDCLKVWRLG